MRRVVVTGLGAVTPFGVGVDLLWESLLAGRSGIHSAPELAADPRYATSVVGKVPDFDLEEYFPAREIKKVDRFVHLAVVAASLAMRDCGLVFTGDEQRERAGAILGNVSGGFGVVLANHETLLNKSPRRVSPFVVPGFIPNMAAGVICIQHGLRGPNGSVSSACAAGNQAIGDASRLISYGDADVMIAGGTEAVIIPVALAGFSNMRALATDLDPPERASRPFDRTRTGFVMSEGAGLLVLEELEHARTRGATIYAEVLGFGMSADAYDMTLPSPDGSGPARCMAAAMRNSKLNPGDIDYINAHGTSTPANDLSESAAIERAFGSEAARLWVSSTKSHLGHSMGAAGGIEGVICALALHHGVVPPTINYSEPDPACRLDYVPNQPRERRIRSAMNNAFGFGGTNSSIVFGRFDG